jgi:hypothetical protein
MYQSLEDSTGSLKSPFDFLSRYGRARTVLLFASEFYSEEKLSSMFLTYIHQLLIAVHFREL